MPVTITFDGANPSVGASADTWGSILNDGRTQIKADLDALAVLANDNETVAAAALPKAGGAMTGDIGLGDPTPGSASSAGFRGLPTVSIDAARTFLATDAGKCIRLTGTTPRIWTVPPSVFAVGASIVLRNAGTGAITLARGAGVELRAPGSTTDADKTLAASGFATLYQEATGVWLVSGSGVS